MRRCPMKRLSSTVIFAAAVSLIASMQLVGLAGGQGAPAPAVPPVAQAARGAASAAPTVVSPEVLPDRRVVFRLYAPQATDVAVRAPGRGTPPMKKDDAGIW